MTFEAILQNHLARYPSMQIQDLYKLVHQAALGSEHAVPDPESARHWLERELAGLDQACDEPPLDPISDDGQIVRVHLSPFVRQGGSLETLLHAFIRTANEARGAVQTLENYWSIAAGLEYYAPDEMQAFLQSMQARNYPPVHHSAEYSRLYRPAYRVVCADFLS